MSQWNNNLWQCSVISTQCRRLTLETLDLLLKFIFQFDHDLRVLYFFLFCTSVYNRFCRPWRQKKPLTKRICFIIILAFDLDSDTFTSDVL